MENAPAWVCRHCGEALFDEADVDALQELVQLVNDNADRFLSSRS